MNVRSRAGRGVNSRVVATTISLLVVAVLCIPCLRSTVEIGTHVPPNRKARVDAGVIADEAVIFRKGHGHWPTMAELHLSDGQGETLDLSKDPWGRPYGLFVSEDGATVTIRSAGADGLPFNDDDIVVTQPGAIRKR